MKNLTELYQDHDEIFDITNLTYEYSTYNIKYTINHIITLLLIIETYSNYMLLLSYCIRNYK